MSRKHARRYKDALYKFTAILLTVLMALPQNGMTAMANTASSATTGSEAAVQVLDKSASDSMTATSTDESSSTASEAVSSSDQSSSVADSATATPVTTDSATSDSTDAQPVTTEAATPEATAEETPATPSMPAQSFNGSASNGVSVTATADEGAFPEGTTMSVATVNSETAIDKAQAVVEGNVVDALAVDITFQDADGNETSLYHQVWQAGVILLPVQSVGVMGDERTYERAVALRAVTSTDAMTADWAHLPYEFLGKVSNDIINKVKGVNRVTYDISSKPPSTIEWE